MALVSNRVKPFEPLKSLSAIIETRVEDLHAYQNKSYAESYVDFIDYAKKIDFQFSDSQDLSKAIARSLYKLMAYKDEYEVARLYSDSTFQQQLDAQFEGDYTVSYHLAVPLLSKKNKHTQLPVKRQYPSTLKQVFKVLAKLRFLRGTAFDVFSYSEERRQERRQIEDYKTLMQKVLSDLNSQRYELAVELASLPMMIRGFGHVKNKNRVEFEKKCAELLAKYYADDGKAIQVSQA